MRFCNCSYGVYAENGATVLGVESATIVNAPGQGVTQSVFYATGAGTEMSLTSGFVSVPAAVLPAYADNPIQTAISYANGATGIIHGLILSIAYKDNTQVGIYADGGAVVHVIGTELANNYTAVRIGAGGANTSVLTQAAIFTNNVNNADLLSATAKMFAMQSVDAIKHTTVPGALCVGLAQDLDTEALAMVGNIDYWYTTGRNISLDENIHASSGTGVRVGGAVTDTSAGGVPLVDVTAGSGFVLRSAPDYDVGEFNWDAVLALALALNTTNYIGYNSNTDAVEASLTPCGASSIPLATVVTDATSVRYLHEARNFLEGFPQELQTYLRITREKILRSGLAVTANANVRRFDIDSGSYYLAMTSITYAGVAPAVFSSFYGTDGATETAGVTDIDITNYDNAGVMTALTGGQYRTDTVYLTSDGRVNVIYGTADHATQGAAEAADMEPAPSFLTPSSFPVAQLVVQQGNGIVSILDRRLTSGWAAGAATGGVSVHGALAGLGADDHTQYLLASGGRAMSGDLDMGGNNIGNVGTVDGLDVTAHAVRHNPGGADAIGTAAPLAVLVGAAAAEGSAATVARADHQHGVAAGSPVAVAAANADGTASSVARSDHVHAGLTRGAADFGSFAAKATPVGADVLLIEDSADGDAKKQITLGDLPSGSSIFGGDFQEADSLGISSTTSAGWSTKLSLVTPALTGRYRVAFYGEMATNNNGSLGQVRLQNETDGVALSDAEIRLGQNSIYQSVSGWAFVTFAGALKEFRVQWRSRNNTAQWSIRNVRIEFWRVA